MAPTKNTSASSTLAIPLWFTVLAGLAIAARVAVKLPSSEHKSAIAWLKPSEVTTRLAAPGETRELIFYDCMADWCPPCKKMERTAFQSKAIIESINKDFIPVRVNFSNETGPEEAATKSLKRKLNVYYLPTIAITLRNGDLVAKDWGLIDLKELMKEAQKKAGLVRAERKLSQGLAAEALSLLDKKKLSGEEPINDDIEIVVYDHTLRTLGKEEDCKHLLEKNFARVEEKRKALPPALNKPAFYLSLINYLQGKESFEKLVNEAANTNGEKGAAHLALALKAMRDNDKAAAGKEFRKAAMDLSRGYHEDKLAEFYIEELERTTR
ncbi:MAG: thioredoxin family protein [Candidatus Melainabacteria bacterium]|nr:thioredoxin family protein [Candidatus Melainabacteria bacterium]